LIIIVDLTAADMSTSMQKKKHIKAVRPKLRAKEPLLGVFMWGINYSASILPVGQLESGVAQWANTLSEPQRSYQM